MKTLSIDIETFSSEFLQAKTSKLAPCSSGFFSVDLKKSGVYKYAESDDFEILLFAYSINFGEIFIVDIANGEKIPLEIIHALFDENVVKTAFNASFERVCISNYLNKWLEPTNWRCTMVWVATLGLPLSLESVGTVLGLDKQKITEGKSLINYFCKPCKPTKVNGGRNRNLPHHDLKKWEQFKEYNKRDVEVELQIQQKLSKFPPTIWDEYEIDQQINDRGILVDMEFVENAIKLDEIVRAELNLKMKQLTNLDNPNSVVQMKNWLATNGLEVDSLGKKEVAKMLETTPPKLTEVLELRQQISKSSIKKYTAMKNAVCNDNRVRGMFQFYGANRTGRFSGRLVQLQNLPQNHIPDLEQARELVKSGNFDAIKLLYDNPTNILSELIRTAFIPRSKFIVADFSAIEARVIAWLAGEQWRLEVFARGEDIYCASASQMFKIPVVKNGINGHLRQKGKQAELACGYGGSVGALTAMGALEMGLKEEELMPLVTAWREANPKITKLWWSVDDAVKRCVKERIRTQTHGIKFMYQSGLLFIELPSGRKLSYVKPRIGENQFGSECVTYEGVAKKWERIDSYGPKFVENIVQAIARDLLMYAINTFKHCDSEFLQAKTSKLAPCSSGFLIVAHVHDEIVIDCDERMSLEAVCELMGKTPPWADGLQLEADGFECRFYRK